MRRRLWRAGALGTALALALTFASASFAQGAAEDRAALEARQEILLQAMLSDPQDFDTAFEHAAVSVRLGDYEAAIGSLERVLIQAPENPGVLLEVGVLYYRLGSFETARSYLRRAENAPNASAAVAERAGQFQAAIVTAEDPLKVSGMLTTGVRFQTNANAGPTDRFIVLGGSTYLLANTVLGRQDWNAFVAGNIHASYDLGNQGDLLEADLLFYGDRYLDVSRVNSAMSELTFGPSFNMARFDIDDARFGVYGIVNGVRLDGGNYSGTIGGGARFAIQPSERSTINARIEYRHNWFRDSSTYQSVSNRNGYEISGRLAHVFQLDDTWSVRGFFLAGFEQAKASFESNWHAGASVGATYRFASPIERLETPWMVDLDLGYLYRAYDAPDPSVSTTLSQSDNEAWVRGALGIPLRSDIVLSLSAEYRRVQSNYRTRDYSNTTGMLSVTKLF
ncbi:lipopolysaccharide assembly protein LapB [Stappia sp. ES.058]|uniref:tetratricopeptide repeat protein n=1 Tax=Stappia sp. ES.058 TaxID=1881061 RepID=UPI000B85B705|nr:tetratricopeptide repeat protein [Stappia sp. ES.058]